jgi:NADP-dependent 3-hydroxy acid dehydrogenase YdfG
VPADSEWITRQPKIIRRTCHEPEVPLEEVWIQPVLSDKTVRGVLLRQTVFSTGQLATDNALGVCANVFHFRIGRVYCPHLNRLAEFGIYLDMANAKRIALITGANRGLGLEMARQLGQAGVTVVVAARDAQKGEAATEKLRGEGLDARALKLDVTNKKDHAAAAAFLNERFGRLDILINNAGISAEGLGSGKVSTTTEDVIHRTFETNFFAPVALTQVLLPLLKRSDAGRIVNMSSILGSQTLHADPGSPIYDFKSLSYDSSKAALNSFTIHLAH